MKLNNANAANIKNFGLINFKPQKVNSANVPDMRHRPVSTPIISMNCATISEPLAPRKLNLSKYLNLKPRLSPTIKKQIKPTITAHNISWPRYNTPAMLAAKIINANTKSIKIY